MHYTCTKCKYEFDVEIVSHPHPINSFISVGGFGCPICRKAMARSKVCPKCGSIDLKQSVMKVEEKKDAKN
ncbi:MAG: hypothetical protein IKP12_02575 [Acholeplasmatales bacterium]|nr:hypothetical protein [Acholeplasmatales bacterium]